MNFCFQPQRIIFLPLSTKGWTLPGIKGALLYDILAT